MRIVSKFVGGLVFWTCIYIFVCPPTALWAAPAVDLTAGLTTTLTLDTVGNGVIDRQPQAPTYQYGEVVTLTATADLGQQFINWSGVLSSPDDWWQLLWDYRVAVNVSANGYLRTDKPVEVAINFTSLLQALGQSNPFDPNSIRVVEVNAAAQVVDSNVVFQFDRANNYNATTNAAGTLVFLMSGTTAANQGRTYHIYFDVVGKGFSLPAFTDQVVLTDNVTDQAQSSFKIVTNNATYFYHKLGAGFSSLVDANTQDWLDYRSNVNGAGGKFRGIPNMIYPESEFHAGNESSTSTILRSGPLKETFRSVTTDGKWEATWEIFPTYARMTLLKQGHNYWFLYEGTPGGTFDIANDFVVRSDGTKTSVSQSWQTDLAGEEWAYFYDDRLTRSLFLINHADDSAVESYKPLTEATGSMTVFGFGRKNTPNPLESTMTAVPAQFTIGLMEQTAFTPAAQVIRGAYKPLTIETLHPQHRGQHIETVASGSAVITLTMTSNRSLIANFAPSEVTLTTTAVGNGLVDRDPDQNVYAYGDLVTLTALPDPGWVHDHWSGDLSGNTSPITIMMTSDHVITATFIPAHYTVALSTAGSGTVAKSPDLSTYLYNDQLTLTATPNPGWQFSGWSGDLTSNLNPAQLAVDGNKSITANFTQEQYTLSTTTAGQGTLDLDLEQATYLYNDTVTMTATPEAGWRFVGWQGDASGAANPLVLTMDSSKSVTALFAQKSYTLALTKEGAGSLQTSPQLATYPHGQRVTITATPEIGWRFAGWTGDFTGTANPATIIMDKAKTIQALFEPIAYTLTVNQSTGGSITWLPVKASYFYGDELQFAAVPIADFVFTGWKDALAGDHNPKVLKITGDATVSAKFTQTPYQITTAVIGSGTVEVNPAQTNYHPNDEVVVTALPAAGWHFAGWRGDLSGSQTPITLTVTSTISVTAQFVKDTYIITLTQQSAMGTVKIEPEKDAYEYGEAVILEARPKVGYRFVRWLLAPDGSRSVTANPLTLTIEDDLVIRPEFEESTEPINFLFLPIITAE